MMFEAKVELMCPQIYMSNAIIPMSSFLPQPVSLLQRLVHL